MTFIALVPPVTTNPKQYGAAGDGKTVTDGAITTGTPTLTSASAAFIAADVGKQITVNGAGAAGANLNTTISAYVNATTVTLAANAGTTVSAATVSYATDDTSAFTSALAAIPSTGGELHISPGKYRVSGITLTSRTDVAIIGGGFGTIIQPTSGATAFSFNQCTRCNLSNLQIDGAAYNGAIGVSVTGNFDAKFYDLQISGHSGDGIVVNGDDAAGLELEINNVCCRDNGGWGYHYLRTGNIDRGGVYLTGFRALYNTKGAGGMKLESTLAQTDAFHTLVNIICDNYPTTAVWFHNMSHIRATAFWAASTMASGQSMLMDGDGHMIYINGAYFINNQATSYNLTIAGSVNNTILDNIHFDGGTLAHIHVTSTGADHFIGQYISFGGSPLTDTPVALYNRSTAINKVGPQQYQTSSTAGASGQVAFDDIQHPGTQKYIRCNNGTLEFLNTAFSSALLSLFDPGCLYVNGNFAAAQSATAVAIASSGTIVSNIGTSRVAPTGNVTGIILATGSFSGQMVSVINESAFTLTFAIAATSHVADGVSAIIAANRKMDFSWDSNTGLWYHS